MKGFGFGCMRLPMTGEEVDKEQFTKMVDRFMEEGFTYYDTARVYLKGKSDCVKRMSYLQISTGILSTCGQAFQKLF